MKSFTKFFIFIVLALVLTACAAPVATSAAVQIPDALKLALDAVILAAVTLGLQAVFDAIKLDLRGVGAAIAVVLSGFAIAQLQGLIDLVPVAYDQLVTIVLNVLVVILSGVGVLRVTLQHPRAAQLLERK